MPWEVFKVTKKKHEKYIWQIWETFLTEDRTGPKVLMYKELS